MSTHEILDGEEPPLRHEDGRLYTRKMVAALAAGASFGFASSVFFLLPKQLSELGLDAPAIGAATSAYGIATIAATPLLAFWIDTLKRVSILRFACALMLIATAAFLATDSYAVVLMLRAAQGCAFACFLTALTALVVDVAPARRLGEGLGAAGASMLAMNAIAPAIAEPIAASHGWAAAFGAATLAAAIAFVITLSMHERSRSSYRPDVASLARVLRQARTLHYALVTGAVGTAFGVMFTFTQAYALELGMGSVRGFFIAYSTLALIARLLFGRAVERLERFRVAVFALNLYTLVVLAASGLRPGLLEPLGALLGLAHGLFFPAFNAILMLGARADERGKLATVFTGAFYGGMAVAGVPFGIVAARAGYPAVFAGASALTFAASALLVFSRALADTGVGRASGKERAQRTTEGGVQGVGLTFSASARK